MRRMTRGFTLIELMIVVAIIAIIAAIAIPGLLRSRIGTNESSCIGSLRSLSTAEEQFRSQNQCDADGDGTGEYGWLGELAGVDTIRVMGTKANVSPFIAAILGVKDANGFAQKSGYMFTVWLPTAAGTALKDTAISVSPTANSADADGQEVRWCCYGWPNTRGQSGNRVFFVGNAAEVYATAAATVQYTGTTTPPGADAAYDAAGTLPINLDAGIGLAVQGLTSVDGNQWVPAGN